MAPTRSSVTSRAEFGDEYASNQVIETGLVVLPAEHPSSVQWEKYFALAELKDDITQDRVKEVIKRLFKNTHILA